MRLFLVSRPFVVLQPLDHRLLVPPLEVMPFDVHKDEPPFCAEEVVGCVLRGNDKMA